MALIEQPEPNDPLLPAMLERLEDLLRVLTLALSAMDYKDQPRDLEAVHTLASDLLALAIECRAKMRGEEHE